MCYIVVERYSVCRCLYYKHSIDRCASYGQQGHKIQERTVLHQVLATATRTQAMAQQAIPHVNALPEDSIDETYRLR
ncbi:hypothetical protein MBM_00443 [Drepanopeziza brunnea f. sp. 'multigermtubi' MB_m1]|uniref:Uncharacterized protein n=1 Tax=Marssonina brunnea f. sp. multigermtubi (strain MB_m1) TaxID=1072389 RepID=K1WUH2_MARBU|nr:uncharacterized protein MBM_00443 [Drepanopeziza brunnea f. sp. 'multigermtubi' MB_m1]EKD21330.1 hypothetical protein MBM_00443 [Drepanopeziza brunnea f. sp. 'multigermtubi' MB_m1]